MATKLQNISELARQTTERLTQSVDNWKRFLDSAAWLYKYPFHEQVLIHAQRPDAKACAPIELWNSRFRRWVNRGAKGIALIDDSGHKPALRYVFDVSDTNTRYNIPFRLWQTKSQYTAQIIEELQNHFGDTGVENADIAATVLGISINAISDNYRDYYEELLKAADNSALADISDDEISSTFVLQLMTSVSHTVLVRMGIDPAAIFHGDEYESIRLFNSPDTIAQLGAATSDISEMVLRQIERSVRSMERQERDALAKSQQVLQNEDRKNERSVEHGTQLQAERGLPDSRYRDGRAADGGNRQIRDDEEGVSQSPSEWNVQRTLASEQADRASAGDRQDGAGAGRTDDGANGESRGRDGELESPRPNGVGTADEQHQEPSRGNGDSGDSPQLTTESPLQAESDQLPAFLSEEKIFGLLKNATYTRRHNKDEISAYFAAHNSEDERDAFIKEAFEKMVYTGVLVDGVMCGYQAQPEGLLMWEGNYLTRTSESRFSWSAVKGFIEQLIERGEFSENLQASLFSSMVEQQLLLAQPEPEARDLALSLELFTEGSLNAFAYPTNADTQSRIIVYDILDLGEQLKTMGLLVITDAILNRVTENWKAGRRTHVYLDEFHVVYENPYSSMFFTSAWRRFRKRNAFPTGITQNVEYLLDNVSARSMLSNSEFIVMHNQAASDREKLAALFNISEQQMNYITNAEAGHGLMKIGNALVPFVNRFPKNTELYRKLTTKPGETELWG